ncbi:MAG: hypothetical protein AB7U41_06645 [Dongiaceae bacterium]
MNSFIPVVLGRIQELSLFMQMDRGAFDRCFIRILGGFGWRQSKPKDEWGDLFIQGGSRHDATSMEASLPHRKPDTSRAKRFLRATLKIVLTKQQDRNKGLRQRFCQGGGNFGYDHSDKIAREKRAAWQRQGR